MLRNVDNYVGIYIHTCTHTHTHTHTLVAVNLHVIRILFVYPPSRKLAPYRKMEMSTSVYSPTVENVNKQNPVYAFEEGSLVLRVCPWKLPSCTWRLPSWGPHCYVVIAHLHPSLLVIANRASKTREKVIRPNLGHRSVWRLLYMQCFHY